MIGVGVDVEAQVKDAFSDKSDADEDILSYVISCLEDDSTNRGDADAVYDTLGLMLVSAGLCDDDDEAKARCTELARRLGGGDNDSSTTAKDGLLKLVGGPQALGSDTGKATDAILRPDVSSMIQTRFDDNPDMSVKTGKDVLKAAKRAERDDRKSRAAAEIAAAQVHDHLQGSKPTILRNTGGPTVKDVHLQQINVANGGRSLIEDGELAFAYGRRYGVVGRNGTGKTSLLRALAAREIKGLPANAQVLHVEQEVIGDDTTVLQAVLECDAERFDLLAEEARLVATTDAGSSATSNTSKAADAAAARLTEVYARLQEIDADGAPARAASILAGLSFDNEMQQRATITFSGGWRMRVALARALFVEPDLLLLDEPTNHLDLHAVLWLEDYLLQWPKTVLLVSHARDFLNAVCTDIIHLHSRRLLMYRGTYDNFVKTMNERLKNEAKQAEALDARKKHMQAFVDKFRYNAKRASLVQSRIKAIDRLGDIQLADRDPEYVFKFPFPDADIIGNVVGFNNVSFTYPGRPLLFSGLDFGVDLDTRAAIVGPNGIGKSTLLQLISGGLEPTEGYIERNSSIRIATFSQHHVDGLELHLSPLQHFARAFVNEKDEALRAHLSSFGLSGELAMQPMYTLSGGQKSRVAFAKITYRKPHVMLLDEPSNHLDMEAVDALIEGLAMYKGGVLMVSHDQWLIEATMQELWMCEGGRISVFHGTFADYKERLRAMQKRTM